MELNSTERLKNIVALKQTTSKFRVVLIDAINHLGLACGSSCFDAVWETLSWSHTTKRSFEVSPATTKMVYLP